MRDTPMPMGPHSALVQLLGVQITLHSDSGPEFHNNLLASIARQLQLKTTHISPYNPSSNMLAEIAVKKTKQQIAEMVGNYYDTWDKYAVLDLQQLDDEHTGTFINLALPPSKARTRLGRSHAHRTAIMDVLQKSEWGGGSTEGRH